MRTPGREQPWISTSPIVVGVSRRTCSPDAVRWAVAEAELRGTQMLAVTGWRGPRPPAAAGGRPPAIALAPAQEALILEERRIADQLKVLLGGDLPSMRVTYQLCRGPGRGAAGGRRRSTAPGARLASLGKPECAAQELDRPACGVQGTVPGSADAARPLESLPAAQRWRASPSGRRPEQPPAP